MARWRQMLVAAIGVPLAVACASVLGIDKAELNNTKGTGGTTGGGGDAGGNDDPIARLKPLCAEYCVAATQNCTGDLELYPTMKFCLAVCDALPLGTRADVMGDSVGCRLHFAESAAAVEAKFNCSAAGPGGNGVCGENCESWCTIEEKICPSIYATRAGCLAACKTFPVIGNYNDTIPTQSGNKFECRLYHVTAAAGIDPNVHCPHTDITIPGPPCGE